MQWRMLSLLYWLQTVLQKFDSLKQSWMTNLKTLVQCLRWELGQWMLEQLTWPQLPGDGQHGHGFSPSLLGHGGEAGEEGKV